MNSKFFSCIVFLFPLYLHSQSYKFNRQTIITYQSERKSNIDTWNTPIFIQIKADYIIMRRPPHGSGEKASRDSIEIKNIIIERKNKQTNFTKYTLIDGRILIIYNDQYITMATKETKDHKRIEYVFYNQENQ